MAFSKSISLLICLSFFLQLSLAAYDPKAALEYTYASGLTHCPQESIRSWNCGEVCKKLAGYKPFFSEEIVISSKETFAVSMIVNPSTKKFVTTYRGTQGNYQLILEILQGGSTKYGIANIPGAEADSYFYTRYVKYLRPTISAKLQEAIALYPDFQYVFTGHSLGGALTTLTAFDAVSSKIVPNSQAIIYNYGSPRVGNYQLIEAIEAAIPEIYRIVHYKDLVPHVPPCLKDIKGVCKKSGKIGDLPATWPAYHLKNEIFYDNPSTSYVICNGGEDPKCSDQFAITSCSMEYHEVYMGIHVSCSPDSAREKFNVRGANKSIRH